MIYRLIQERKFPAPYKISSFAARWSDREIVAWIDDVKEGFEEEKAVTAVGAEFTPLHEVAYPAPQFVPIHVCGD
jgi:hypothetical protein